MKPEQNELLVRVEGDAPMGQFLRQTAWVPAVVSEVLKPGAPPYPIRLFGEDFVAFRGENGKVGFFSEFCPHRGVSLLLARNEDNALRCIFHGWKFSNDGRTVEAPTQLAGHETFCAKVPLEHYPVREAAGMVWVWLGKNAPGPMPDFDWLNLSGENIYPVRSVARFNWIQSLEGLVDSAHVAVLHQGWLRKLPHNPVLAHAAFDTAPLYEFEDRPNGFRYASIRDVPDGRRYIRVTEYAHPWYCYIPSDRGQCIISVPIDDENTAFWVVRYDMKTPLNATVWNPAPDPMNHPPSLKGGKEMRWGQDRAAMQRDSFTGYDEHLLHEDFAVAESQGRIARRDKEFLNAGDQAVVRTRSLLLRWVTEFMTNGPRQPNPTPPGVRIAAHMMLVSQGADWRAEQPA